MNQRRVELSHKIRKTKRSQLVALKRRGHDINDIQQMNVNRKTNMNNHMDGGSSGMAMDFNTSTPNPTSNPTQLGDAQGRAEVMNVIQTMNMNMSGTMNGNINMSIPPITSSISSISPSNKNITLWESEWIQTLLQYHHVLNDQGMILNPTSGYEHQIAMVVFRVNELVSQITSSSSSNGNGTLSRSSSNASSRSSSRASSRSTSPMKMKSKPSPRSRNSIHRHSYEDNEDDDALQSEPYQPIPLTTSEQQQAFHTFIQVLCKLLVSPSTSYITKYHIVKILSDVTAMEDEDNDNNQDDTQGYYGPSTPSPQTKNPSICAILVSTPQLLPSLLHTLQTISTLLQHHPTQPIPTSQITFNSRTTLLSNAQMAVMVLSTLCVVVGNLVGDGDGSCRKVVLQSYGEGFVQSLLVRACHGR